MIVAVGAEQRRTGRKSRIVGHYNKPMIIAVVVFIETGDYGG